jgi:hypothetical protein
LLGNREGSLPGALLCVQYDVFHIIVESISVTVLRLRLQSQG